MNRETAEQDPTTQRMGILMKLLWLAPVAGAVIGVGHAIRVIHRDTRPSKEYIAAIERQKEATQYTTT